MSDGQLIATPSVFGETGNFLLERELGKGGMGGVYMGRDKMLDRPVAVKVMLKEYGNDPEFVEKFKKEAQAAARLIHPNIAQIYSYGIADGMPYIAMELVAGGSLDQVMRNGGKSTDVPRVMKICEQVAQALRCAADQGLVHGDVKPENVLLDSNGNAKLVDFGLAAMQKDTTEIWGTPYYIAPEKVKKEPVDYRADMYSLGGTLYHALTGVAPFEGDDANAVVRKRFEGQPKKPSEVRPGLTPQIDALVMKMLALSKEDRFPTFEALLAEFKKVMTSGLTASSTSSDADSPSGGKRIVLKKKFKVHRPAEESAKPEEPSEDAEDEASEEESEKSVGRGRFKIKGKVKGGMKKGRRPVKNDYDDEEEGGNVGGKVTLTIVGIIAIIGAVIGGLIWYQVADKKARDAQLQKEISDSIGKAHAAIAQTRKQALSFRDEFDEFAERAITYCQKPTDSLNGVVPDDVFAMLKPSESQELLDAIASTNIQEEASADTNAAPATAETPASAAPAATPAPVAPVKQVPKFRPPTEDEADPMSPLGQQYQEEKRKWEEEQAKKQAESEPVAAPVAAPVEAAPAAPDPNEDFVTVIREMNDLWNRAYGCKAAAIKLHAKIDELVKWIDESAAKCVGNDRATADALAAISRDAKDRYEQIKAGEEVTKVQKGITFIKSKGEKTVKQTVNDIRVRKLEQGRKEEAARKEAEEVERQKRLAEEKAQRIVEETKLIKEKFDALASQGVFRLLDWASAKRQLENMRDDFIEAESQVAANGVILKVTMMETVQQVFICNCKDYVFTKSKLKKCKILDINDKEIKLQKADGKGTTKLTWVKFYQTCHGNLNELIITFIQKGRNKSKLGDGRLNTLKWAEAMMGAALTMQVICSDDPAAQSRGEQIAREAVKQFPDYLNHAQEIFPDINFEAEPSDDAGAAE